MEELKIMEGRLNEVVAEFELLKTPEANAVLGVLYATLGVINGGGLESLKGVVNIFVKHQMQILREKTSEPVL